VEHVSFTQLPSPHAAVGPGTHAPLEQISVVAQVDTGPQVKHPFGPVVHWWRVVVLAHSKLPGVQASDEHSATHFRVAGSHAVPSQQSALARQSPPTLEHSHSLEVSLQLLLQQCPSS
jgi:hypothetical protein